MAEQEAKWGKLAGVQTEEFRYYDNMLKQAREMDRRGEESALLTETCHTQGMYALTPSGKVLGMIHQWDRPDMYARMLRRSLLKWAQLSPAERRLPRTPDRDKGRLGNVLRADLYPEDGLVLTEITRSLPYEPSSGPRYRKDYPSHPYYSWLDHAWFRKDEARQFLPERIEEGAGQRVPRKLLERLARFHLGTNTDTIAGPFAANTVREARLTVVVVKVTDGRAECSMEGATLVDGPQDSAGGKNSGYAANLLGRLVYDLKSQRFVEFDLVALGLRTHGGPEVRPEMPNPMPRGVLLTLADRTPAARLPPTHLHRYGWE